MNHTKLCQSLLIVLATSLAFFCSREVVPPIESSLSSNSQPELPEWFEALVPAYRTLQAGETEKAAELLYEAAKSLPEQDWEIYLVTATLFATHKNQDAAFQAIGKSILAGMNDLELLESLPEFASLHEDPRWETLAPRIEANINKAETSVLEPNVLKALEEMWTADQEAWQSWNQEQHELKQQGKHEARRLKLEAIESLARENQFKLDSIIARYGWPGFSLVGKEGAKLSWGIAQHSPDIFYKEKFLYHLQSAVALGDAAPNDLAELSDRIARDTWRKQRYGSSMSEKAPHPIEDAANVDHRRVELGLLYPVEVYAFFHGIHYERSGPEEAKQAAEKAHQKAQSYYADFLQANQANRTGEAQVAIDKAIDFYGDLTSQQLYEAAVVLAGSGFCKSENTSLQILEVLVWRRWDQRSQIQLEPDFQPLRSHDSWSKLLNSLEMSLLDTL